MVVIHIGLNASKKAVHGLLKKEMVEAGFSFNLNTVRRAMDKQMRVHFGIPWKREESKEGGFDLF